METNLLTYLACICFLIIFGKIFIVPITKIVKLVINSIIGGVLIFLINLIGGLWGFHIGLNIYKYFNWIIRITRCSMFDYC